MLFSFIQISHRLLFGLPTKFTLVRKLQSTLHYAFSLKGRNSITSSVVELVFASIIGVSRFGKCSLSNVTILTVFFEHKQLALRRPLRRWVCSVQTGLDLIRIAVLHRCFIQLQDVEFLRGDPYVCVHSPRPLYVIHNIDVEPMAICVCRDIRVLDFSFARGKRRYLESILSLVLLRYWVL